MRATVAKRIRKAAYGAERDPGGRKYYHHPRCPGTVIADERRHTYQRLKRAFVGGKFVLGGT